MKKLFIGIIALVVIGVASSIFTGDPILNYIFSLFGETGERIGLYIMIGLSIVAFAGLIYKVFKK